jgi:hypothetical protein
MRTKQSLISHDWGCGGVLIVEKLVIINKNFLCQSVDAYGIGFSLLKLRDDGSREGPCLLTKRAFVGMDQWNKHNVMDLLACANAASPPRAGSGLPCSFPAVGALQLESKQRGERHPSAL